MIKTHQTRVGAPHGNCEAACYASIFEVPIESVPDPGWPDDLPWQETQDATLTDRGQAERTRRYEIKAAWLKQFGFASLCTPMGSWAPSGYAVGTVTNPRGIPHAVVVLDGVIVWDPNPMQDSYDRPLEWLELFTVIDPARTKPESR